MAGSRDDRSTFGDLARMRASTPPPLDPAAAEAIACWNWCGGWAPALLPTYAAIHGVADIYTLTDLLLVIREHLTDG